LFFVVLPGTGQRASRPSGSKRPEAERMPRLRLTLQSRVTSKVFVNVTIGRFHPQLEGNGTIRIFGINFLFHISILLFI
jgi:hypothetical protein